MDWFMCPSMSHPYWTKLITAIDKQAVFDVLRVCENPHEDIDEYYIRNICGIKIDRARRLVPWVKNLIEIAPKSIRNRSKISENRSEIVENRNDFEAETRAPVISNIREKEIKKEIPPKSPKGDLADLAEKFDIFWSAYPRKDAKEPARKSFAKHWQHLDVMLAAIERQKQTRQWQDKIIPLPATWLNQKRWEDEGFQLETIKPRSKIDEALSRTTMTNRWTQEVYEMSRFIRHPTQATALLDAETQEVIQLSDLDWG